MSLLDVGDGGELVVGLGEVEGVFELALHVGVWREGGALGGFALGVELEQLAGHVLHGLLDAGFGLLPGLGAEFVEGGRGAGVGGAVLLDEVEAGERDVEFGLVGELEDHEFEGRLVVLVDHAQATVLGDAVLDVDDVIADGKVAEVGDEGGGFGFGATDGGAGGYVGVVGEVLRAEDHDLPGGGTIQVHDLDTGGDGGLDDDGGAQVSGEVAGLGVDGGGAGGFVAGAEAVGDLILLEKPGETLDFALVGSGEEDAGVLGHERLDCIDEGGDGAVEALGGAGGEVDFGEITAVGVEHIHEAELVEFAAAELAHTVVEVPGGEIDVFGADEIADAGALVALLDLVPPAFALIFDHAGLFDEDAGGGSGGGEEVEQGAFGSGDGGEELPAGKDGGVGETYLRR